MFANTNLDEEGRGFEPQRRKSSFFCGVEGSNERIEWKDRMHLRSAIFRGTRGHSNQPSLSVAPSNNIV